MTGRRDPKEHKKPLITQAPYAQEYWDEYEYSEKTSFKTEPVDKYSSEGKLEVVTNKRQGPKQMTSKLEDVIYKMISM